MRKITRRGKYFVFYEIVESKTDAVDLKSSRARDLKIHVQTACFIFAENSHHSASRSIRAGQSFADRRICRDSEKYLAGRK